jgi:hypothetical protein
MGTAVRFIAALVISLLVAFVAGQMIAMTFGLTEEYIAVMFGYVIFALVAIALFAVTYPLARKARAFNWTALGLALLLAVLSLLPNAIEAVQSRGSSPYNLGKDHEVVLALLVPGLLLILVQWGQVRRRWQSLREPDGAWTCWPWATTVVGAIAVLNPLGLEILKSAFSSSGGDMLRGLWLMITLAAGVALVIGAIIEYRIRLRAHRARVVAASKALAPESEKWQQVFGNDTQAG